MILVSIVSLAYNHAPYIRQCLDGFMMQKTNFEFEVLIHDDASTDETADIIREYEKKYPNVIKPIYQKENQYSKGVKILADILFPRAKGKYIALCEGDDYWTDPLKLQKQVDFLDNHMDYVMCSHRFKVLQQNKQIYLEDWNTNTNNQTYYLKDLVNGAWLYQPLTVIFRKNLLNLEELIKYPKTMDVVLFYHILKKGKGYLLSEKMATYRLHDGGVWSAISLNKRRQIEFETRLAIYQREHSFESATFLRTQFSKSISRKWMLNNPKIIHQCVAIFSKHFGFFTAINIVGQKILFNKIHKFNK